MRDQLHFYMSLEDGNKWKVKGDYQLSEFISNFSTISRMRESNNQIPTHILNFRVDHLHHHYLNKTINYQNHKKLWRQFEVSRGKNIRSYTYTVRVINCPQLYYIFMSCCFGPIIFESIIKGGIPVHAALIELKGNSFLLVGRGNAGKTTCYMRIRQPWKALCDDESLIVRGKNGEYKVHPFPTWSEYIYNRSQKSWEVEYATDLKGIFFIEQADADSVYDIGKSESVALLVESAEQRCHRFWSDLKTKEIRNVRKMLFYNAIKVIENVPSFRIKVSLRGKFWKEIEKVIALYDKTFD